MENRRIIKYGFASLSGFCMGFYGTAASRAMGNRIEENPLGNGSEHFWASGFAGMCFASLTGPVVPKMFFYFLGLAIGSLVAKCVFDSMHPDYQYTALPSAEPRRRLGM